MSELHSFGIAAVMAVAATFSGIGVGFLWGFVKGTDTPNRRGAAMLVGMLTTIIMLNCQIWLAYNGYRL